MSSLQTLFSENKTTSATTINGIATNYTNKVIPSTFVVLTVNYYGARGAESPGEARTSEVAE